MQVNVLKRIRIAVQNGIKTINPGGDPIELPDAVASEYLRNGAVERYETKVIRQDPLPNAGAATQSPASPAAPVSTKATSRKSTTGGRKKAAR
jgi:hypothetical protein